MKLNHYHIYLTDTETDEVVDVLTISSTGIVSDGIWFNGKLRPKLKEIKKETDENEDS